MDNIWTNKWLKNFFFFTLPSFMLTQHLLPKTCLEMSTSGFVQFSVHPQPPRVCRALGCPVIPDQLSRVQQSGSCYWGQRNVKLSFYIDVEK